MRKRTSKPERAPAVTVQRACSADAIPMVLFDGYAVWLEMTEEEKSRTQMSNVSDVLDAVVRLMRRSRKPNAEAEL